MRRIEEFRHVWQVRWNRRCGPITPHKIMDRLDGPPGVPAASAQASGIFVPLSLATTLATYLLITVGGLVRAAGAGLGCPDWPHCFGSYIPPLDASDLPPGFDASQFNVINTWLEYVNRLLGVTIGFLIFATLLAAWRRPRVAEGDSAGVSRRRDGHVIWPTTLAFLLVGFQGWLGGKVVTEKLDPTILTVHLIVALVIVGLLLHAHLWARWRAGSRMGLSAPREGVSGFLERGTVEWLVRLGWLVGLLVLAQAALGTRVRGVLQAIEKAGVPRTDWLPLGWWPDLAHRQLAVIVVLTSAGLVYAVHRLAPRHRALARWARRVLGLAVLQVAAGLGMAYGNVPRALQVTHLTLSSLLIGVLSVFLFVCYAERADPR